jgi:hypothetical protein
MSSPDSTGGGGPSDGPSDSVVVGSPLVVATTSGKDGAAGVNYRHPLPESEKRRTRRDDELVQLAVPLTPPPSQPRPLRSSSFSSTSQTAAARSVARALSVQV